MNNEPVQRVVILGHTGFIGSHLLQTFRERSPEIRLIGRALPDLDLTQSEQAATLAALFDSSTAVVVLAGVKRQWGDTLDAFEQNLKITGTLARALQQKSPCRVIFFSSAAVYGEENHNLNITEETSVAPTSLYGIAKFASERLLWQVVKSHSASFVSLRPPLVYGPGDRSFGYGPSGFTRAALKGEAITLWGDGTEQREFVFVRDVAEIVWRLTPHDFAGALNLVTGSSHTFRDVLDALARNSPQPLQIVTRPRSKPRVDHVFSNALLRSLFPDFSFTRLEDGVRLTWEVGVMPTESAGTREPALD